MRENMHQNNSEYGLFLPSVSGFSFFGIVVELCVKPVNPIRFGKQFQIYGVRITAKCTLRVKKIERRHIYISGLPGKTLLEVLVTTPQRRRNVLPLTFD